jgi:hypothetical protein
MKRRAYLEKRKSVSKEVKELMVVVFQRLGGGRRRQRKRSARLNGARCYTAPRSAA